ncbi:hypothetical protein IB234_05280 [Pseudomonas sp. PDM16]|uniref:hypothetical protein n=1 Tax=Pseudomonas sp. PDM16 TaxID=2769292 RepID=UPI001787191F|nr:hypothetical protein [Pseudomonas sp. PDM16]MBD9413971.1 hypothetical protein [Pseudomonas sp. PDM16]
MKKSLSKAVALAATIGAAASVQAVSLNHDGVGQVLLYPIYTAENGNDTYVSVTNTTNQFKVVKVRFVEGMNSKEVLDFNLFLSPQDVWTGNIVQTAAGAKLTTADTSCTAGVVPAAGLEFRNFEYQADAAEFRGTDRARVGHLEVIEMAEVLDPALQAAIDHRANNGVPGNCELVRNAYKTGGVWNTQAGRNGATVSVPTGGLYGTLTVINVESGTEISADATALENFRPTTGAGAAPIHFEPGDMLPNLDQAYPQAEFPGVVTQYAGFANVDAVSAVLMKNRIANDYAYGAGLNAQTDFVITFPTKTYYVNGTLRAPFAQLWNPTTAKSCDAIDVTYYNREELSQVIDLDQISPRPPAAEGIALCHETNVFSMGADSNLLGGKFVRSVFNLAAGFEAGWVDINLAGPATRILEADGGEVQQGLPVIGFSAVAIQNGDVGGLLSNYATAYNHKSTSVIPAIP